MLRKLLSYLFLSIGVVWASESLALEKYMGPVINWCPLPGHCYAGENVPESTLVQDAFMFGSYSPPNGRFYNNYAFKDEIIDFCEDYKANRCLIITGPTWWGEQVQNQPADTALYYPYPGGDSLCGIIQAGVRASRLSKIHAPACGLIFDDSRINMYLDTASLHDIRDAVKGKYVDPSGKVHHDSTETTP